MPKINWLLWGIAAAVALGVFFVINGWRLQAREYEEMKPKWEQAISSRDNTIKVERENRARADKVARDTQEKLDALEKDRRDNPLPPVRVCRKATTGQLPGAGQAATVTAQAPEADHPPADERDSHDIGPALDDFATDAQANLIQCQALIDWHLGDETTADR